MARIISTCGRKACCPQILEKDGQYQIFDEVEKWQTHFMSKDELIKLGKAIESL